MGLVRQGAKRKIDKTKKSNIKCEHCEHWGGWKRQVCDISGEAKYYYNRCKKFEWASDKEYKNE